MKSPVLQNETEFKKWLFDNTIGFTRSQTDRKPSHYPVIVVADCMVGFVEFVYYSDFQKARYKCEQD